MNRSSFLRMRLARVAAIFLCGALAAVVTAATGQPAPAVANARANDPQNPAAAVPATTYRSAFENYRALGVDKVQPWRETNDTVGRIGGWRVYLRESQQGGASPSQPVVPPMPKSATPASPALPTIPVNTPAHKH